MSLLSASAGACLTIFSKPLHVLMENQLPLHLPPKHLAMASTIVEIVIERAFRTENMPWLWLFPVHEIRYKFFLPKMYFYQEPFQEFA